MPSPNSDLLIDPPPTCPIIVLKTQERPGLGLTTRFALFEVRGLGLVVRASRITPGGSRPPLREFRVSPSMTGETFRLVPDVLKQS